MEAAAFVGKRYRARCPVEQTHANARLESRHSTADAGLSEPESFSGSDEITGFHHRGQDADAAEQPAIERHDDLLSSMYGQRCVGGKCRNRPNVRFSGHAQKHVIPLNQPRRPTMEIILKTGAPVKHRFSWSVTSAAAVLSIAITAAPALSQAGG